MIFLKCKFSIQDSVTICNNRREHKEGTEELNFALFAVNSDFICTLAYFQIGTLISLCSFP
jgi:hypothetical protein